MMGTANHRRMQQSRAHPVAEIHAVESQCETVYDDEEYDDELTEEEEEDSEDEDDENEEDDDSEETVTEASSSPQCSKGHKSRTLSASLSPDIQKFVSQMPEVSQHFGIVGKIGEGMSTARGPINIPVSDANRNLQLCLQGGRPQLSYIRQQLGCKLGSDTEICIPAHQKEKRERSQTTSQVRSAQENIRHEQSFQDTQ